MRLVNISQLEGRLPDKWREQADAALEAVKDLSSADRKAKITDLKPVWDGLKPLLANLSSLKCWYCESPRTRADMAVDHFRPKNRVQGVQGNDGYWWLAFAWRNYRYSCTYCNSRRIVEDDQGNQTSGGKHDNFPIAGQNRGTHYAEPTGLDKDEKPDLLDPTKLTDTRLLTFDINNGQAVPAVSKDKDADAYRRAQVSIQLYHLYEGKLREARFEVMVRVREAIRTAQELPEGSPSRNNWINEIASWIRPDANYSAAARAMLMSLRGTGNLAQEILDNA